ncbi:MAG: CoA-binding protein, partial [Deltaproteobacteria bacterium]|nr:CoA-binding protein [Deltaproteobacteria bacterium]
MNRSVIEAFEPIFYPKSVAVIGASTELAKFGNIILSAIMEIGYEGGIYPVNPEGGEIKGLQAWKSLKDIPGEVDLAILTIPAPLVSGALEECLRQGVKGVEILTSGFKETGNP